MPERSNYINKYNTAEFRLVRPTKKRKVLAEKSNNTNSNSSTINSTMVYSLPVSDSSSQHAHDMEVCASPLPEVVYINDTDLIEIKGQCNEVYGHIRKIGVRK